MAEPTTTTGLAVSTVAAVMLELIGISPAWLFAAFFGSVALQAFSKTTIGRWRAMAQVASSSVLGALLGAAGAQYLGLSERGTLAMCGICAFGLYPIITASVNRIQKTIGVENA